ncbi:hypothetical protein EUGRSUZ_B03719 [Eucalyptus grandis]|uniref:Uncharacterized protein n=2 Tax=Eucalyptus grandis TaxID=71139 RepID=A0ACC3LXK9_EUCGR|nr:hypothetical protein EUGRSUZ_B03719 [Eucalyptus grandis]
MTCDRTINFILKLSASYKYIFKHTTLLQHVPVFLVLKTSKLCLSAVSPEFAFDNSGKAHHYSLINILVLD